MCEELNTISINWVDPRTKESQTRPKNTRNFILSNNYQAKHNLNSEQTLAGNPVQTVSLDFIPPWHLQGTTVTCLHISEYQKKQEEIY